MGRISLNQNGFTLIEILIIVMILGIIGMTGVPALTSVLGYSKLSSAGRIMVAAIETTASLSIRYKRPFQFQADVNTNTFQIKDTAPYPDDTAGTIRLGNLPPVNADDIVFNTLAGTWYQVDFDTIGTVGGVLIDSGPAALTFYPDGHSAYADSVYVLSLGELSNTITINGITGRITVD
jgi:prepilin-type N-terminal cleavage/methylation domain-containing protein